MSNNEHERTGSKDRDQQESKSKLKRKDESVSCYWLSCYSSSVDFLGVQKQLNHRPEAEAILMVSKEEVLPAKCYCSTKAALYLPHIK